jgi:hypothetical protein
MSKTSLLMKKVSIALTSGIAISSLTGCGAEQQIPETTENSPYYETTQPVYENPNQIEPVEENSSVEQNVDETTYEEDNLDESTYDESITNQTDGYETEYAYTDSEMPYDENCADWEFDYEDNIWICNDSSSSYYRNFFFLGTYFVTKNMLYNNNDFQQYKTSGVIKGTNSSIKKSGFGSGVTGGYGG